MLKNARRVLACMVFLTLLLPGVKLQARAESPGIDQKAVVFLLDSSNSMNSNDKTRLAIDSIAQLIYSLPSDYSTGFVAYNTEVVSSAGMLGSKSRETIMTAANHVRYIGYTNAGAGLSKAMELLGTVAAVEKTIVILSDGEIVMQDAAATAASSAQFQAAVTLAKENGVKIHVVGLGTDMEDNENTIFSASSATGGAGYHAPKATDLQQAVDSILLEQLQVKKTTAALIDASGGTEELDITIPSANASTVRVLFTSNSPIQNLKADFNAGSVKQFSGIHYTLLELERPTKKDIHVSFSGQSGSQVKVDVITEYAITAKTEIHYTDTDPVEDTAEFYDRTASLSICFYDADNPNLQVLADDCFNDLSVPLTINEKDGPGVLSGGTIQWNQAVTADGSLSITVDLSKLATNLFLEQPIEVALEGPPLLPPPPDYRPYYAAAAIGVVLLAALLLLLILRRKRSKPQPLPEPAPPVPSKYSYTGKLNIYITRTQSGYDIPPLAYDLFRLPSGRVLSLKEILDECNVEEYFEGASKIFFKSGAGRCLVITNNSDCTIIKNKEILLKNRSYQIPIDSKIDITFEDEVSELAFQYRDVKPNELYAGAR